jgi:molybdate transport system substrate-binding protein
MKTSILRRLFAAVSFAATSLAAPAADLTVSAAASLTNALRELAPAFEAQNPGTQLVFNFAASDALLAQIAKGAPADVFASADAQAMDRAEAQKLLEPGTRRDFATNTLVMIEPRASTLGLAALTDLRLPEVTRVAIGNPASVPAGRYAKAALERATLWPVVERKAVLAQSVRQALDYVARGEVEAGFVYATDAALMSAQVRVVTAVATATPIVYPIAAVAGSPNPPAARRFIAFIATPEARSVLARHGFGPR